MSYTRQIGYKITPDESFRIIRNCSGCGKKSGFLNTSCFRVNANGRKIDIWLIYQCENCKHTTNLTVYERRNPQSIEREEYEKFLSNSSELALKYGTDSQFFSRNKAEIDWTSIRYSFIRQDGALQGDSQFFQKDDLLVIDNTCMLKIRKEKVAGELLKVSGSKIKELEKSGIITVEECRMRHHIRIEIHEELRWELEDPV